jgi:imidazolonepropionase-like amidohydrolase
MSPGESMRIAITQAHVVVGAGETIDDGVVVLNGNRIESVSADESASGRGYDLTVDLEGRTLIPGMIDVGVDSDADAHRACASWSSAAWT